MFDIIRHTTSAAVADNGTFTVSYPSGKSSGAYALAHGHKMACMQSVYTAPDDFTLTFGASDITVTWKADTSIPAGTAVVLQVEKLADNSNEPSKVRPQNTRILRSQLALLDLGSPATADADGVAASQTVTGVGTAFTLNGALVSDGVAVFDTPRNVVGAWTNAAVLTITGKDVDGNTVVEKSASGTSHTGTKAFAKVTSVTTSATITSATVGTGTKIGLPVYVGDASAVLAELKDGVALPKRSSKVYLTGRMLEAAVDAGTAYNLVSPVAGRISKLTTISQGDITTGGGITVEVNTVAVDGLSVTVADASAEGDVDSDTPTAGHATAVVAVGDRIEIIPAAAFNASADIDFVLEIDVSAAGQLDGTFVAGVTSAATATTGDTRGTYTPSTTPDGTLAYQLLVNLPDPSNQGVAQYDG